MLVGGIEARLIAVMPGQINLKLPDHPWENEKVDVQVIRDGRPSARVPVYAEPWDWAPGTFEDALNYFDAGLLHRVVPGRQPLRGGVR